MSINKKTICTQVWGFTVNNSYGKLQTKCTLIERVSLSFSEMEGKGVKPVLVEGKH